MRAKTIMSAFACFLLCSAALAQDPPVQLFPITDVVPEYPVSAARTGREGWVYVQFTVTTAGSVRDLRVSHSEPSQIFDEAALSAAQQLRFEPQFLNGTPIEVPDVGYIFRFSLSENSTLSVPEGLLSLNRRSQRTPPIGLISTEGFIPSSSVSPVYPEQARARRIGGWVIVRFTVTDAGTVEDAQVVDSEPPEVFDAVALRAITEFHYEPRVSNGRAVTVTNVYHLFKFRP